MQFWLYQIWRAISLPVDGPLYFCYREVRLQPTSVGSAGFSRRGPRELCANYLFRSKKAIFVTTISTWPGCQLLGHFGALKANLTFWPGVSASVGEGPHSVET